MKALASLNQGLLLAFCLCVFPFSRAVAHDPGLSSATFLVALVRGLAAAFSIVVMFLGFLWIAWDKDKQSWHDKIAGTAVVRLPHTPSLMCI